eukprot:TRINITY_DN24583_c0_g1_i1.p1 TRINITY_DN24583_c0_g1~~TRINITY_DN24583_c0_g1_i1.p1  ORF type:complete len:651 (+),score=127.30 TRINITY_DN24583_c0_g1_i1:83-2035(+)
MVRMRWLASAALLISQLGSTLLEEVDCFTDGSCSTALGDAETAEMRISLLQMRRGGASRAGPAEGGRADALEGEKATGSSPCPKVGTLRSEVTHKEGYEKVCSWKYVRYATIDSDLWTGEVTSGTGERINYGDWGPARITSGLEHIEPDTTNQAAQPGSVRCLQMQSETGKTSYPTGQADCLALQIYAPKGAWKDGASPALPVAVWIHGGMFVLGASDDWAYEGSRLASRGMVVVAINYRLGPYGFSTFDKLTRNNGVRDQRQALRWIHQKIAKFGGDPENIGIFGNSAGATSVTVQALYELHHPHKAQIIKRAVSQSNPLGIILENPKHKEDLWQWESKKGPAQCMSDQNGFCKNGRCSKFDHFKCMQGSNATNVLRLAQGMMTSQVQLEVPVLKKVLQNFYGYGPCLDGEFVKRQPKDDVVNLRIPTMQGTNREEGIYFAPIIQDAMYATSNVLDLDRSPALTKLAVALFFGLNIFQHYPGKESGFAQLAMPFTDYLFTCPMRENLYDQSGPVYRYQLHSKDACSAPSKKAGDCGSCNEKCVGQACHANEVPVVFGTWSEEGACCKHSAKYKEYADLLGDLWYRFFSGQEPWDANNGDGKVKVLGLKHDGGVKSGLGDYQVHATKPSAGLFWKKTHICDRMKTLYSQE